MATPVYAGQRVIATVGIANTGNAPGTFILTGQILYKSGAHAGWFFPADVDYCGQAMPAGANEYKRVLAAGEAATVTMYKRNWACGINEAFADYELFDVVWRLRCVETGAEAVRTDRDALQHRRRVLSPPYPRVRTVSLSKTSVTAGDLVIASVSVQNTGERSGTFRLRGTIYYDGGYWSGNYAGRFTKRNKDYCTAPKESDWDYVDAALGPGEVQTLTMYKANIACGIRDAFDSGQRFRCVFEFTCLDTGVTATGYAYFTYYR